MKNISILVFIFVFMLSILFVSNIKNELLKENHKNLSEIGDTLSQTIETKVSVAISSVTMNGLMLRNNSYKVDKFNDWAPLITDYFKDISSIQLAPNAIVKHVYPLEGNEKVIGHDLFKDINRKIAATKAMNSNELTFVGPIKLIQDNQFAVIVRKPITIVNDGVKQFWGFSTAIIHLKNIFKDINLKLDENIYNYSIYGNNPDAKKAPLFLSSKIKPSKNASKFNITVPNGNWILVIEYNNINNRFAVYYLLSFLISIFISYLVYTYLLNIENKKIKQMQEKEKKLIDALDKTQAISKIGLWYQDFINNEFITSKEFKKICSFDYNEEIKLTKIFEKIDSNDVTEVKRLYEESLLKEGDYEVLFKLNIAGQTKYIHAIWNSTFEDEKLSLIEGSIQDITKKVLRDKELEEQKTILIQQQRLAQQGEMLEMIGHQWKQPLSVLNANSQLAGIYLNDIDNIPKDVFDKLAHNTKIVEFLSDTINDFKDFFSEEKIKTSFNISDCINKSIEIIDHRIKNKVIHIEKEFDDIAYKEIIGFKRELGQVILAVANNAIDILEEKEQPRNLKFIVNNLNENKIQIKIIDNAGGIPENILPNIFDSYFSTKKHKNGTGLGLHMSKMIIENSFNGTIIAYNETNGACFELNISI